MENTSALRIIFFRPKNSKCQGDHGGCGANCRCCLPALAGFVSPHSMGPGETNKPQVANRFKIYSSISSQCRLRIGN